MSSVRSKVDKFEALSRKNDEDSDRKRRFQWPGKSNSLDTQSSTGTNNFPITSNKSPKTITSKDIEADLQEVWSVRKNIHHTGGSKQGVQTSNSSSALGSHAKGGHLYSRHGAIPAQPTQPANKGPFGRGPGAGNYAATGLEQATEAKRTPLQDFNAKESPWNVKKGSYSYNYQTCSSADVNKRPIDSAKVTESFVPAAKRKINVSGMDVIRPGASETKAASFPLRGGNNNMDAKNADKINYAKKMAQGYLKSVGMGEFTPKSKEEQGYPRAPNDSQSSVARWKKMDDDHEFEFDI